MNGTMNRRSFLGAVGATALGGWTVPAGAFVAKDSFVMWHSPGCGCCLEWAKRIEASFGRKLPIVEVDDIVRVKRAQGVPGDLQSCHTALIHGYVVEGHVPPVDIRRLVESGSKAIKGLAVPGMPAGSPGMDVGHDRKQPYKVYAFAADGKRGVFASHG